MEHDAARQEVRIEAFRRTDQAHQLPAGAYIDTGTLLREAYREPRRFAHERPIRPVAPYDPNPQNWRRLPWRDMHTGESVKLKWSGKRTYSVEELPVQTHHDVIARYVRHPEAKAVGGDSEGTLAPRHIVVIGMGKIRHIGKEANQLEEVQALGLQPETYLHYQDEEVIWKDSREALWRIPKRVLAIKSGVSERQIARFMSGRSVPRKRTLAKLLQIARAWREGLRE